MNIKIENILEKLFLEKEKISNSESFVFFKDKNFNYIYFNSNFSIIFNRTSEDMKNKSDYELFDDEKYAVNCRKSDFLALEYGFYINQEFINGNWYSIVKRRVSEKEYPGGGVAGIVQLLLENNKGGIT